MTLPCAVKHDEDTLTRESFEELRFQHKLEAIDDLCDDISNAINDSRLGRNATLKIMRLRCDEMSERLKEMEG